MDRIPTVKGCELSQEIHPQDAPPVAQRIGLWVGLAAFVLVLALPAPQNLSDPAWRTAAVAALQMP